MDVRAGSVVGSVAGNRGRVGKSTLLEQVGDGGCAAGQAGVGKRGLEKDIRLVDVCALVLHKVLYGLAITLSTGLPYILRWQRMLGF